MTSTQCITVEKRLPLTIEDFGPGDRVFLSTDTGGKLGRVYDTSSKVLVEMDDESFKMVDIACFNDNLQEESWCKTIDTADVALGTRLSRLKWNGERIFATVIEYVPGINIVIAEDGLNDGEVYNANSLEYEYLLNGPTLSIEHSLMLWDLEP